MSMYDELTRWQRATTGSREGPLALMLLDDDPAACWHPVRDYWEMGDPWQKDPLWPESLRTERCAATALMRGREASWRNPDTGTAEYRPACTCGWLSDDIVPTHLLAVELAHDHTHPGWRETPLLVPLDRFTVEQKATWARRTASAYPDGWWARGGPVRVLRSDRSTPRRDVAPGGGWELPVPTALASSSAATEVGLFDLQRRSGYGYGSSDYGELVLDPAGEITTKGELRRAAAQAAREAAAAAGEPEDPDFDDEDFDDGEGGEWPDE